MESQSGKGDPSKPPASDGGKGDPSKSPVFDGGKGGSSMTAKPQRLPIKRPTQHATKGRPVMLLTNHFKVSLTRTDQILYHYDVTLKYDDGKLAIGEGVAISKEIGEGVGRKVMKQLYETYASHLAHKVFAYDGEKGLFTVGPLPFKNNVFDVVLCDDASSGKTGTSRSPGGDGSPGPSDKKRMKRSVYPKRFKVEIAIASTSMARIPMSAIAQVLRGGQESENSQEAIRVLDILLRQHSARQGCLLVKQSFFHDEFGSIDLGGGVRGCRGFHSSFRPTQNGLSLNVDLSTTMVLKPGPVIDFLLFNQNIKDPYRIDWVKANRALKKLWISTVHTKMELKIVGLSEKNCNEQTFPLKRDGNGTVDITVYDYFMDRWSMRLEKSARLRCLNVGKPDRPTYLPLEVCQLVPLQRYKKSLSTMQRSKLVEGSRQKPLDRKLSLSRALRDNNYDSEPMLRECGISIAREFMQVEGRVLQAPQLSAARDRELYTPNGRWNFNKDRFIQPIKVKTWGAVNFSAICNVRDLVKRLIKAGIMKGIQMEDCAAYVIEDMHQMKRETPEKRVEDVFQQIKSSFKQQKPEFLLCVLPEKNSDIYGLWKCKCLAEHGIVTQCVVPPANIKDQYLTNVLLKINAKLGGLNSLLKNETTRAIPLVSKAQTIIFGMDVSHGSPGSNVPSVAAVVSSLGWPLISKYRASVRTQAPRMESIDNLFKQVGDDDQGLIKESLIDFLKNSKSQPPEQIIIFRDGVSEGQFNMVLTDELTKITEACKFFGSKRFGGKWFPKFTVIIAQKNHHTRFFLPNERNRNEVNNVQPGTVVDKGICHPRNYDFYMCAHAGMIGTTRPTHYHVLHDDIGFSPDDLQELVHNLSYVYQRSTTAISVVAPIYYAHLAAAQVAKFTRLDDMSETSSSHATQAEPAPVPELPRLHPDVASSMFFC